ncbi:5-oxoprolinase subunit B/C family protein [Acinetobacter larvae]|uniref:Allophanate hydrolase n=1 Tax=Acinetobacter larvae TaxID=1789224 RepID=A0A1B2LWI4_9GAMM|nr:urea amidolyase family protein [Acinetobacter larvae]AOA57295.1 allophanate hydrolase [Acinetobacter larvae]
MRFLSVNIDSFLIELPSPEETLALYRTLSSHKTLAIQELVPAARTILVIFDDLRTNTKTLVQQIQQLQWDRADQQHAQECVIPICYDGEDLAQVAELQGLSIAELISRHQHSLWQVAFIGFAPGFAYLSSPDRPFSDIPRLATPRKKIPAGALGLAGQYSGIYPKDSPGGWQLIGSTTTAMWDLSRSKPALLTPGMSVIFEDVSHAPSRVAVSTTLSSTTLSPSLNSETETLKNTDIATATHTQTQVTQHNASLAMLSITAAALQMLVQDEGRFKQAHQGVSHAGAMDRFAMHSANRMVGNPPQSAVVEILNGGFKANIHHATVIAVTGAQSDIKVYFSDGRSAQFSSYQSIALDAGDAFLIQNPHAGLRHYLAIRGGIAVPAVLGSCSYDSLAALGPAPLQLGDTLYSAQLNCQPISPYEAAMPQLPKVGDVVELDLVLGPRPDWFSPESIKLLFQQHWQVSHDSNRVGLRLLGEQALQRKITHELDSEGTCIGALQIPPNGQPVLFMHDHPLTGGYPVIGAVAKHHWNLVAQIPAGCQIKFNLFSDITAFENAL